TGQQQLGTGGLRQQPARGHRRGGPPRGRPSPSRGGGKRLPPPPPRRRTGPRPPPLLPTRGRAPRPSPRPHPPPLPFPRPPPSHRVSVLGPPRDAKLLGITECSSEMYGLGTTLALMMSSFAMPESDASNGWTPFDPEIGTPLEAAASDAHDVPTAKFLKTHYI